MAKIVLCSHFRNAEAHVGRYFDNVWQLHRLLVGCGDALCVLIGEGDSTDRTRFLLEIHLDDVHAPDGLMSWVELIDVSHGGPAYGSVVDAERFRQLAYVANRIASQMPADSDAVLWVESDLLWEPATLLALLDRLADYPAVAPRVMHASNPGLYEGDGPFWYDTFAFRRNGAHFTNEPPYHPELNGAMLQVDSAGSCLAVRGDLARQLTCPEEDVIVGMCRQIYALGGSVWLDPSLIVEHP